MSKGIARTRRVGYHSSWFFEGTNGFDNYGQQFDRVFEDKLTAENLSRPALQEALAYLEDGDLLVVQSLSGIANSASGVQAIVKAVAARKCLINFRDEYLFLPTEDENVSQLFQGIINAMVKVELMSQMACQSSANSTVVETQPEPVATNSNVVNIEGVLRHKRASGVSVKDLQEQYNLTRGAIFRMTASG